MMSGSSITVCCTCAPNCVLYSQLLLTLTNLGINSVFVNSASSDRMCEISACSSAIIRNSAEKSPGGCVSISTSILLWVASQLGRHRCRSEPIGCDSNIPKGGQKREYIGAFWTATPKGASLCLFQEEDLMMADRLLAVLKNGVKRLASLFGIELKGEKASAAGQSETYTE